ncbi:glycoside hydrolase family 76 protein [Zasmidium cellare ATCC 36951]|uniref:mannan endo-1,6-alpha-mannosidase n=1 Tax=Zasmidium cellare ATCC 36951 TaxID=1080233 RepID=A0A6A6CTS6_ZASCE|nr:glycoside hydrolase family 76 protein [Zasmidium cellare ATCC 36951]KAF2169232.1 glycoside hydrolase family 76 protein [Zasmidium cellare ATCC 36951]
MVLKPLVAALTAATYVSATKLAIGASGKTTSAATTLAGNLMTYYSPTMNGLLPQPYWWWESAGMWDTAIHYWHYSGDAQYNTNAAAAILAQAGLNQDFMQASATGNDDQLWWGLLSMSAAEYGLPPPAGSTITYLQLATNVFNSVSARWDKSTCNGGLGWQIDPNRDGYHYKNSISNGLLFQLAARLGRYTNDQKYLAFAEQVFDWTLSVGLIDKSTHSVYDGTDALKGCIDVNHDKWSYNAGVFLYGTAVMLSTTTDTAKWQPHLEGFVSAVEADFTSNNVLVETKCEASKTCNTDQLSFKAYLTRWLVSTQSLVPDSSDKIQPLLKASADGALASCNGSPGQNVCGSSWTAGGFDGVVGVGQQMAALEVTQGFLAKGRPLPGKMRVGRRFVA